MGKASVERQWANKLGERVEVQLCETRYNLDLTSTGIKQMGKRKKSSRKPGPSKKKEPLETTFACIFCHHEKSVACKIDKKELLGHLYCKICGQTFQTRANYLTEPVDIFADWIDASEAASKLNSQSIRTPISPTAPNAGPSRSSRHVAQDEEERPTRRYVEADSDDD
ncbi:related to ELF1-Protein required for growth on glycerol mediumTranscription elongation factor, implicated in the maintenance of proper chromatin structure [Serendipita indica DSM 11827]|uniref:Transcription elongation factor 1 homolog n=1 Tax=Serendipita indica (strain DSM 11827) TaxID=1109443 RepID=G4TEF4_SERID|nr:related to ELF1-Protein required for growth on glycerol mediumTranscription elongation factor, implicated in the maintenance of proper chromatin structure [Serendipita indica DSM 11827]